MNNECDLWVFGYGSLMWRPGFDFIDRSPARLIGFHRALCIYSHHHRGTPERPGLVLGLDRGGSCRGMAFRICNSQQAQTVAYLRERELVTSVYLEVSHCITLEREGAPRVLALTYICDRHHAQYAGKLSLEEQLHFVQQGEGVSGTNRDYVKSTVAAIESLGLTDGPLHALAAKL